MWARLTSQIPKKEFFASILCTQEPHKFIGAAARGREVLISHSPGCRREPLPQAPGGAHRARGHMQFSCCTWGDGRWVRIQSNVCQEREKAIVGQQQPCVQAFTRLIKMQKQGCTGHRCYFITFFFFLRVLHSKQVYTLEHQTVYKCCPGWTQQDDEAGCLHLLCSVGTCFNGGKCSAGGPLLCECPEGFQGPRCQYDVDECAVVNAGCQQSGVNTRGSFYCVCDMGYRLHADGRTCIVMDPCTSGNGGCSHICQNERGFVKCECQPGYYLSADGTSCGDIDECAEETGRCAHRCMNTLGSFICVCSPGFELGADGKQCIEMEIVNSCESNNDGCSHHCQHSTGGPHGSCNQGYLLDLDGKTCRDVDECESNEACCSQFCINYVGGYECSCKAGFQLNTDGCVCDALGEDEEEEEKLEIVRIPDLRFRKPPQLLHYAAALGAFYEDEDKDVRGELTLVFCLDNTFGNDCSLSCDDCMNGGKCNRENSGCICSPGWTGIKCNESKSRYHVAHHLMCLSVHPLGCPKGFFGKNCNKKCTCANNGYCHRLYGACLCDPGLYGRFCHLTCPRWVFGAGCSEECQCVKENTLACSARNGVCTCKPGYQGNKCQKAQHFYDSI
uniref:EGF-like domain-containing protein n=1 Tax=Pelusios castaneus TaxID=367368 RepID=A0A8C8SKI4_9SAUR